MLETLLDRAAAPGFVHFGMRQVLLNPPRCLDEIDGIIIMFLHAGGDRENVGIENDVLWRKPDLLCEQVIAAPADLGLALEGVGLAALIESHHNDRGPV